MAAFFIVNIDVKDADKFEEYRSVVPATIEKYGGEYLARGGEQQVMEGEWPNPRTVLLKFPSMEQARAWYDSDDYAGPKALRLAATSGNMVLVEGL